MSTTNLKRLFKPGTGVIPPYLAGRKEEQAYFQDCVDDLKDREPPSRDLILYGPRGNGKTALLRYLQKETLQKEGAKLDILWVTPNEMGTLAELTDRLTEDHQALRKRFKSAEVSGGVGFIQAKTEMDWSPTAETIRKLLQARSGDKPFILIIDEAHRLKPAVAESLLNASQSVRSTGSPFLLVLAGTPNLSATLGKANASFWERNKKLPLGRLSPEEAGQALVMPLQKAVISFAPGIIEYIVEQTHCYPFFTQVWGDCLARSLDQTRDTEITQTRVQEAKPAVTDECDAMYQIRRNEMEEAGLLSIAESVADAFIARGEPVLHGIELDKAIERGMVGDEPITNERGMEALDQLSHLGYVWRIRVPGGYAYEPGIPGLMTYVNTLAQVKAPLSLAEQTEKWRVKQKAHEVDTGM